MVKRLVKVPFVNMRVMFPREENRKDVTFKMRRGASLRAELLRNRVEMPTCCEDMNCLCNCAVRVRVEIPSSRRRVDGVEVDVTFRCPRRCRCARAPRSSSRRRRKKPR